MKVPTSTALHAIAGLLVAGGLSIVPAMLSAGSSCPASTACAQGTELYGYTIECDCNVQGGMCSVTSEGHSVKCDCTFWPTEVCDCEVGCS